MLSIAQSAREAAELRNNQAASLARQFRAVALPSGVSHADADAFWAAIDHGQVRARVAAAGAEPAPALAVEPPQFAKPSRNTMQLRERARMGRMRAEQVALAEAGKRKVVWGEPEVLDEEAEAKAAEEVAAGVAEAEVEAMVEVREDKTEVGAGVAAAEGAVDDADAVGAQDGSDELAAQGDTSADLQSLLGVLADDFEAKAETGATVAAQDSVAKVTPAAAAEDGAPTSAADVSAEGAGGILHAAAGASPGPDATELIFQEALHVYASHLADSAAPRDDAQRQDDVASALKLSPRDTVDILADQPSATAGKRV